MEKLPHKGPKMKNECKSLITSSLSLEKENTHHIHVTDKQLVYHNVGAESMGDAKRPTYYNLFNFILRPMIACYYECGGEVKGV